MPERRAVTINRLDQIMPEVDRLINAGYEPAGNWTLGQVCNHLTESLRMSIEGYGVKAPWLIRMTVGKIIKGKVFKTGSMKAGIKVPEKFLPKSSLDDRAEVEALRAAINHYYSDASPRQPHPFFGTLTREETDRLHCIHAAHHLSFLVPK